MFIPSRTEMLRPQYVCIPLLWASTASLADNCEAISAQIDAKIRATGASNFTLRTAGTDETVPGKVVGTCGNGTRRILYTAGSGGAAAATPAAASASVASATAAAPRKARRGTATSEIITECKDGTMSLGGECKN